MIEANPHCCQEAALGVPFYVPCNKPATTMVGWPGRGEGPYRMCDMCADHNIHNRNGKHLGVYFPEEQPRPWTKEDLAKAGIPEKFYVICQNWASLDVMKEDLEI